jgi:alcohol dehydrogenase
LSRKATASAFPGSNKIDSKLLITHRFKLDRIIDAYETFGNAAKTKALKVIIKA